MSNMKSSDIIAMNNHNMPTNGDTSVLSIFLIMPPYLYSKPRQISTGPVPDPGHFMDSSGPSYFKKRTNMSDFFNCYV